MQKFLKNSNQKIFFRKYLYQFMQKKINEKKIKYNELKKEIDDTKY